MYMFRFYMNLVNFDLKLNLQTSKLGLTKFLVVIKQLFVRVGEVWVEGCFCAGSTYIMAAI